MNNFKRFRLAAGFKTQEDVSRILNINRSAIAKWEAGLQSPKIALLPKIAKLYGVSIDDLLNNSTPESR
jgi:transcriptional regulator with XRE-family HTH domain